MRKRKSPIALLTVLGVVVCGIVGYSFATSTKGAGPADAPPPQVEGAEKTVGDPRASEPKEAVANDIRNHMTKSAPKSATDMDAPRGGPPGMGGPSILTPAAAMGGGGKPEKPKPNSSSTSTQWYNQESALSKDKD